MSAAITGTKILGTPLTGGAYKIVTVTVPVAATSSTITLTAATHGITAIKAIIGAVVTYGIDDAFTVVQASFTGLVITMISLGQDGLAADGFSDTTVAITVIGTA